MIDLNEIRNKAHHSILLLLGLTRQICCPECGSEEWYRHEEHVHSYKDYACGYERDLGSDFVTTTYSCHECYHNDD